MRLTFFLFITLAFVSCKQNNSTADKPAEQLLDSVFTISGIVNGAGSGSVVVLQFLGTDRKPDTANITGNQFEFKGKAAEALVADIYIPQESHEPVKGLKLVVENSVINVEGKIDSFFAATVIGGISNNDFNTLRKALLVYEDSLEMIGIRGEEANIAGDSVLSANLHEQYYTLEKEKNTTIKQFAIEHPKSIAGAYFVTTVFDYSVSELDSIYNAFDSTIKNHRYVNKIKEGIDAIRRTSIGQIAPDFELKNLNGKSVSLSSLKSKYVFVDFWASWCAPCRAENPNLVKTYKQFKGKDFEILGVSLDDNKQEWLQAIKKDKLTWQHVSDLKGWESSVVPLYGLRGIPANFLVDTTGKIIARDMHGDQLQKKLEEIFKKPQL
ncbi:MAG TPA: TlpA disulfide reductase family protein [Segetibacter sp.]|jgi:peroxiredoxin